MQGKSPCIFLLLFRKSERVNFLSGSDAIADFKFRESEIICVSEQSLIRRFAPYKSSLAAGNGNISHSDKSERVNFRKRDF